LGWEIVALNREPHGQAWTATAIGPEPDQRATGHGQFHFQALNNLAITLRELRGAPTG
jgi:hypothetical protein